jgi:hypothetical protein
VPQIQPLTIFEHLVYTTVRLEISLANGTSIGTGFVYDHFGPAGEKRPLLVTNKHVVSGCQAVTLRFHQRDTTADRWAVSGYVDLSFPLNEQDWVGHSADTVDLTAIPLSVFQRHASVQGKELGIFALAERFIPTDLFAFDAVENVVMIGYPIGLWDSVNNYPLVRRGITASHPGLDYNGRPEIAIDMACFPGSSGSPVLLPYDLSRAKPVSFFDASRLFAFLGVLSSGPQYRVEGQLLIPSAAPIPTQSLIPSNLGYIIKARAIAELARQFDSRP